MAASDNLEPIPISALEHFSYCPRQYALIHREQTYDENIFTMRGSIAHERVDQGAASTHEGIRVERAVPLWSEELGLVGKADVVEFHEGTPFPVEYKMGRRKPDGHADLQVCAQAMCLEEMLRVTVLEGAVYHVVSRQRRNVKFTPELRQRVKEAILAIRSIEAAEVLPPPVADRRCPPCSLIEVCMPRVSAERGRLQDYYANLFRLEDPEMSAEPW